MAVVPKVLTVGEVAALCTRLEGRRCSRRQVTYLLIDGGISSEAPRRGHGRTRVFGVLDVAFVRLAIRLQREGVSPMVTRVTLTYLRSDLIRAWKASSSLALSVVGLHGSLQPALKPRPVGAIACVPLLEIWRGLEHEVHKAAAARDEIWMWRSVPVNAVPRATA